MSVRFAGRALARACEWLWRRRLTGKLLPVCCPVRCQHNLHKNRLFAAGTQNAYDPQSNHPKITPAAVVGRGTCLIQIFLARQLNEGPQGCPELGLAARSAFRIDGAAAGPAGHTIALELDARARVGCIHEYLDFCLHQARKGGWGGRCAGSASSWLSN